MEDLYTPSFGVWAWDPVARKACQAECLGAWTAPGDRHCYVFADGAVELSDGADMQLDDLVVFARVALYLYDHHHGRCSRCKE